VKWFKHISDSLDDPFIFDLMTEFGPSGYVVFFGTLEIYSREFLKENGWKLVVSLSFLHQKLRVSPKKIKTILQKIHKWDVVINSNQVTIYIPKFKDLMDEWTARKLPNKAREEIGSQSGVTPKILIHEADKELDKDIKANTVVNDLKGPENGNSKSAFLKKIQDVVSRIKIKFPDPYFNQDVLLFIQTNLRKNPDALVHCLESILKAPGPIIKPKAYLDAAMKIEDGKFNAAESEQISNEHKTAPINLGALIQGIGKPI